jgi:hypothetical protein
VAAVPQAREWLICAKKIVFKIFSEGQNPESWRGECPGNCGKHNGFSHVAFNTAALLSIRQDDAEEKVYRFEVLLFNQG